ncbi:MAG: hypothetical protein Q4E05_01525 [Pseudoclavibacter sp.]|nr:hypothetical protein [Pseudoclavibacter sp.]
MWRCRRFRPERLRELTARLSEHGFGELDADVERFPAVLVELAWRDVRSVRRIRVSRGQGGPRELCSDA